MLLYEISLWRAMPGRIEKKILEVIRIDMWLEKLLLPTIRKDDAFSEMLMRQLGLTLGYGFSSCSSN